MKPFLAAFILLLTVASAIAEEPAGEHGEKKPPPKPFTGSPIEAVQKLPAVMAWDRWVSSYQGTKLSVWGESYKTIDGVKCWGVAVGEFLHDGKTHIWRRFCVPLDGTEIVVESNSPDPNADITYTPYGKWADKCKPTESSEGSC